MYQPPRLGAAICLRLSQVPIKKQLIVMRNSLELAGCSSSLSSAIPFPAVDRIVGRQLDSRPRRKKKPGGGLAVQGDHPVGSWTLQ